jgi:hypothetical protein
MNSFSAEVPGCDKKYIVAELLFVFPGGMFTVQPNYILVNPHKK